MATAREVAEWMKFKLELEEVIYQSDVVYEIADKFGSEHTYNNERGNLAISKAVLKEFRNLTEETAVWEKHERLWRTRTASDDPEKRAAD